jgi:hypothetical protein
MSEANKNLEAKLKEIEKNKFCEDLMLLLAALRRCRRQRDSWWSQSTRINHCGREYIESEDDELLAILDNKK